MLFRSIRTGIRRPGVTLLQRPFQESDLDGAWWVVAAAPPEINRQVGVAAEARRLFVNAVDDPHNATAYLGGVVRRDDVTIAISTGGRAPALAGLLREALDHVDTRGGTALYDAIIAAADEVIFMDRGQIIEHTTPDGLFNNPREERTRLFLSQILH